MIDQTIVDSEKGNCMQAVLASLFEKTLDETINVIELPEESWFQDFISWVNENTDFTFETIVNAHDDEDYTYNALKSLYAINGLFYGVVPSKVFEGCSHAVLIDRNGIVVHDPNPNKLWQGIDAVKTGELEYWYLFTPKNISLVYSS